MKRYLLAAMLLLPALMLAGATASAQKNKKKDDKSAENQSAQGTVPASDNQMVDNAISETLAGWQLGDVEMMHKHYADNVMVISGAWEPALVGWDKYATAYKALRGRMENPVLERSNTYMTGSGNVIWATYQWDFRAMVEGQSSSAHGQTTLVFEKRNGIWLIVLNHTSLVPESQPRVQTPAAPAKNPGSPASSPSR